MPGVPAPDISGVRFTDGRSSELPTRAVIGIGDDRIAASSLRDLPVQPPALLT